MNEHDYEPMPGLPAPLPSGETILWQGKPDWRTLARRVLWARQVSLYFVMLAIWGVIGGLSAGMPALRIAISALRLEAVMDLEHCNTQASGYEVDPQTVSLRRLG